MDSVRVGRVDYRPGPLHWSGGYEFQRDNVTCPGEVGIRELQDRGTFTGTMTPLGVDVVSWRYLSPVSRGLGGAGGWRTALLRVLTV